MFETARSKGPASRELAPREDAHSTRQAVEVRVVGGKGERERVAVNAERAESGARRPNGERQRPGPAPEVKHGRNAGKIHSEDMV
jgi:hypothetical protein